MSKKGIKQAFPDVEYIPQRLMTKDIKLLAQDYTRQRDIMQKRYKSLEKQGFDTNFQRYIKSIGGELPKLRDLKKEAGKDQDFYKAQVSYWLSEAKRFETEETTVKYQKQKKKQILKSLNESGYDITTSDYNDFIDFMNYSRNTAIDQLIYNASYKGSDVGYNVEPVESSNHKRTESQKSTLMQNFKLWKENGGVLPQEFFLKNKL